MLKYFTCSRIDPFCEVVVGFLPVVWFDCLINKAIYSVVSSLPPTCNILEYLSFGVPILLHVAVNGLWRPDVRLFLFYDALGGVVLLLGVRLHYHQVFQVLLRWLGNLKMALLIRIRTQAEGLCIDLIVIRPDSNRCWFIDLSGYFTGCFYISGYYLIRITGVEDLSFLYPKDTAHSNSARILALNETYSCISTKIYVILSPCKRFELSCLIQLSSWYVGCARSQSF